MKTALFAAALLMSTAAFAQTTTPAPADPATAPVSMPDNTAPHTDNAGTPVISDPAPVARRLQPGARHERRRRPLCRSVAAAGPAGGDRRLSALLADRHRPLHPA